ISSSLGVIIVTDLGLNRAAYYATATLILRGVRSLYVNSPDDAVLPVCPARQFEGRLHSCPSPGKSPTSLALSRWSPLQISHPATHNRTIGPRVGPDAGA